jgi:glycosyltransferase involved in cell wall biosynthesis
MPALISVLDEATPSDLTHPAVSVLMAAYNSETTLAGSVRSVLSQTWSSLELLVVDDASNRPVDDFLATVDDPRVRVLRHDRNRGVSAARNTGLRAARAPLVAQLDADDSWDPAYLEAVIPCFGDPRIGLAYSNAAIVGGSTLGAEGKVAGQTYINDATPHPVDHFPAIAARCPIPAPAVTMRAEAVRAVGGYAEWLWSGDYHLYLKLAHAGWRFAYVNKVLASYFVRPTSMSSQRTRMAFDRLGMWTVFAVRHPRTPGAIRQCLVEVNRGLRRASRSLPGRGRHDS